MSTRRPFSQWESATEAAIRDGIARGEFDALPGNGQPIDGLDQPHDELWWVRRKLAAERVDTLPPTLALRRERELVLEAAMQASSAERVRALVEELNVKIRRQNTYGAASGPPTSLMPIDVDRLIARWTQQRPGGST